MNQENKGVKSKCCGAGARFIDEIKCCRNCGNEFIPQPSESKPERKCDGCKLFSTMGVHSFTCPIRQQPIHVTFSESLEEKGEEKCNKCEKGEKHGHCTDCNALIEKCKCPERQSDGSWTPTADSNCCENGDFNTNHDCLKKEPTEIQEFEEILNYLNPRRREFLETYIPHLLQQERQKEREKMIEEKEQLLKEVLKFVPLENQVKLLKIVLELKNKE